MEYLKKAIKYFSNQVEQFDLILGGDLTPEYRRYLENKREDYLTAIMCIDDKLAEGENKS